MVSGDSRDASRKLDGPSTTNPSGTSRFLGPAPPWGAPAAPAPLGKSNLAGLSLLSLSGLRGEDLDGVERWRANESPRACETPVEDMAGAKARRGQVRLFVRGAAAFDDR